MVSNCNILCALIGAGKSKRFYSNKLEAMFNGQMLGSFAATQMQQARLGSCVAIVRSQTPLFNDWLTTHDYRLIINENPEAGVAHSIALAAQAAIDEGADALLISLADMPFVPVDHFHALAKALTPLGVISTDGKAKMPPAIFPRTTFADLTNLTGDAGARHVINAAFAIEVAPGGLIDVDTRADLIRYSAERR